MRLQASEPSFLQVLFASFDGSLCLAGALHENSLEWVRNVKSTGLFPRVEFPTAPYVCLLRRSKPFTGRVS
jgi:hypothetical protein